MAALTTRQAARERILRAVVAELDRIIPSNEAVELRGRTFREWEDQADEFDRTVTAILLQERAALDASARVGEGGRCPHCGSQRVYLEKKDPRQTEVRTPHGQVVLGRQSCRCRSCDRTFSPSGPGLGPAGSDPDALAQGR
jgi:DNA-directed RNA polymerase subunit RPC12/RpoP